MGRALELAARGRGRVEPNPPVGAVVVRDGRLLGEGWHQRFGGPHAEVNAIAAAGDCGGATLYVTLSPCTGLNKKTPPCVEAVLRAGFRTVVIGAVDPTQESAAPRLREAGMEVVESVLPEHCLRMVAPFLKLKQRGMPYVIAKWAMTADGKIATVAGDSRWVSSEESRLLAHQWRNEVDAVLIGLKTALKDDPELTCRLPEGRSPLRIVLDSHARLPLSSRLVQTIEQAPLMVACLDTAPTGAVKALTGVGCQVLRLPEKNGRPDLDALLRSLGRDNITNLMIEGGGEVLAGFLEQGLVDEVRAFIAPKLVGGRLALSPVAGEGIAQMAKALVLQEAEWKAVGPDMLLTGLLGK